jgi:hypothetical protein
MLEEHRGRIFAKVVREQVGGEKPVEKAKSRKQGK